MTRCFFAAWPDDAVRDALAAETARRAAAEGGRQVRAPQLHLTLVFVGSVEAARLDALRAVGDGIDASGFDLSLDRSGRFDRSGVAWIAPDDVPPALVTLQRQIADGCRQAGSPIETRPYRPHVTLLRNGARRRPGRATPGANEHATRLPPAPIAWAVRDFVLVVSRAAVGGSVYTPIGRWPLR